VSINFADILSQILLSTAHGLSLEHIENMIVSSLIHGLVYGVIFKLFHALPLPLTILVAILGVGGIWYYFKSRR